MEGRFVGKSERLKIAQQIKNTHFKLGGDGPDYWRKSFNSLGTQQFSNQTSQIRTQFKQSNFNLGPDKKSIQVQSEMIDKYREYIIQPKKANETLEKDLRSTHFNFGSNAPNFVTQAKDDYKKREGEQASRINPVKDGNIVFGSDKVPALSSSQSVYTLKKPIDQNKEQLEAIKKDLRKSHFPVGYNPPVLESVQRQDYNQKALNKPNKKATNFQQQHFELGQDKPTNQQSLSHRDFNNKGVPKRSDNNALRDDLRSSHFKLGDNKPDYQPIYKKDFVKNQTPAEQGDPEKDKQLRQSHFTLGNDKDPWNSQYRNTHRPVSLPNQAKNDLALHRSNINMGNDGNYPNSTARDSFRPLTSNYDNLGKRVKFQNQQFCLGKYPQDYNTSYQEYGSKKGKPSKLEQGMINDLRSSHFVYGYHPEMQKSQSQRDFGRKPMTSQNARNPHFQKQHFQLGGLGTDWLTMYRGHFTWISPKEEKITYSYE